MIKDIMWDFDGTLFDTYPAVVEAFLKALKNSGIEETGSNILDYLKISEGCAVNHFSEKYSLEDGFKDRFNAYKKDITPEVAQPFPHAAEVCRQIAALGGRNYIITHRGGSTLNFLEHYGMLDYFTEVVTKKHGFKRKPDPEAFVYLIEKYHINRDEAMIVGDRELEILGGKAAGIKTCLYNTNKVDVTEVPDYEIESLEELLNIINP